MDPLAKAAASVYHELEATLRDVERGDFDDLLRASGRSAARERIEARAAYRERFQFMLVDEYQDTNRAQYQFVTLLGGEHGNVCVVGDDDQSIYGWRGADIRNILDFEKDFPKARIVRLEENYRSTSADSRRGQRRDRRKSVAPWKDAPADAQRRRARHVVACAR